MAIGLRLPAMVSAGRSSREAMTRGVRRVIVVRVHRSRRVATVLRRVTVARVRPLATGVHVRPAMVNVVRMRRVAMHRVGRRVTVVRARRLATAVRVRPAKVNAVRKHHVEMRRVDHRVIAARARPLATVVRAHPATLNAAPSSPAPMIRAAPAAIARHALHSTATAITPTMAARVATAALRTLHASSATVRARATQTHHAAHVRPQATAHTRSAVRRSDSATIENRPANPHRNRLSRTTPTSRRLPALHEKARKDSCVCRR